MATTMNITRRRLLEGAAPPLALASFAGSAAAAHPGVDPVLALHARLMAMRERFEAARDALDAALGVVVDEADEAARAKLGLDELESAHDTADAELFASEGQLLATVPTSFAGLKIIIELMRDLHVRDYQDHRVGEASITLAEAARRLLPNPVQA
jgi:hypothetical protein